MKHLKYIITAVAVALFAASCSQDDYLAEDGGGTPVTGQTQTYTFTVSPDIVMEGNAKTRSEGTDAEKPTRCFMQVFDSDEPVNTDVIKGEKEGDSYTFTITLASGKSYDYCFYADNGNHDINDLRDITWQNTGKVVAYAHKWSGEPEEEMSVTLTHIVTKITLKHKGEQPFTVAAGEEFKITLPCADTYNVLSNTAVAENGYEDFTYTFAEGKEINDGDEVCSFYTIVPADVEVWSEITLNLHQLTQTISGIEWKSNSHVTLQGDLSESNPKWGATSEYVKDKIDFFFKDENDDPEGTENYGVYIFYLQPGNIADLEAVLSAIFHKDVKLDLTNMIIFDEVLDNDYTFAIWNDSTMGYLYIYINESHTYTISYADWNSGDYEDFSVVSDKLN